MNRLRRLPALVLILVVVSVAPSVRAFTRGAVGTSEPIFLHWETVPTYVINRAATGPLPNIAPNSDPVTAVRRAFETWVAVPLADVQVVYGGLTDVSQAGSDGVNVVSFIDSSYPFNGALAVTQYWYDPANGEIAEADLVFNPTVPFATKGSDPETFDIQQIATHEIGHFFGLAHSGILSATMFPYARPGVQEERFLDLDDRAGIGEVHPRHCRSKMTGGIGGHVRQGAGGWFGAQVLAVDESGTPVAGALSRRDGTYSISGLTPGRYRLVAEPLNGPVTQSNLSGYWSSVPFSAPFRTQWRGGNSSPAEVEVTAGGQLSGIDFDLPSGAPSVNPTYVGKQPVSGGEFDLWMSAVDVLAGDVGRWKISLLGSGLGSPATFRILGPGVTQAGPFSYSTIDEDPEVRAPFDFDAGAAPGGRMVIAEAGGEQAVSPAGIEILPNPGNLYVAKDPLHPDSVLITWYGGHQPYQLQRSTSPNFGSPVTLVSPTDPLDHQYSDPVRGDNQAYFYRLAD